MRIMLKKRNRNESVFMLVVVLVAYGYDSGDVGVVKTATEN